MTRAVVAAAVLLSLVPSVLACPDLSRAGSSRWTIESRDGVSWLVTPCGSRFFSIGINALNGGDPPGRDGVLPYHWSAHFPDHTSWLAFTRARVREWGFNTAGATSLPPALLELPVIPDLSLGRTARFHWVDPFDPASGRRMMEAARRLVRPYKGNAYRIGYFADNEVGWWNGALFAYYLEQAATNHTKRRLVGLLRAHYGDDWRRFARDFVPPPGVRSFDALLRPVGTRVTLRPGGHGIAVVERWTGVVAKRYYRLVRRALRAADPEALVFSDRLPIYYDPAAVRAMVPYVDAIATNYNVDSPDGWIARYYFDGLRRLGAGRAVLVSEWFFAARENRTGNLNNGHLMTVETQAERARGAAAAVRELARDPSIVGAHWFQYYDHPRGGRADGEDYNFGLVDVTDRPYGDLVAAFALVNPRLDSLHGERGRRATAPPVIPPARIDVADHSLDEWPKEAALIGGMVARAPDVPFADLYLAWDVAGLSLALIGMDYYAPELIASDAVLPLAECFHVDWGVDTGAGARRFALYIVPPRTVAPNGDYLMQAKLCEITREGCQPVPGAVATYFGADQPRITAEVRLPWSVLGSDGPPARVRTALAVTAFHRARWMSSSGRTPAITMRDAARWRVLGLERRSPSPPEVFASSPSVADRRTR